MYAAKKYIGRRLFRLSGVDRVHIIGCARSGTTLMLYALIAFQKVVIINRESGLAFPDLAGRLRLATKSLRCGGVTLISKRPYGWFLDAAIDEVVQSALQDGTGIIQMVRDPRLVVTSKWYDEANSYVDAERWHKSVVAGERIWTGLKDYSRKLIVRYEDLIEDPGAVEQDLCLHIGLSRRKDMAPLGKVKTNLERAKYTVDRDMEKAMHRVRDIDETASRTQVPARINIEQPTIRQMMQEFMATYRYN